MNGILGTMGTPIIVDNFWPRNKDQPYSVRFDVHPIIHWLSRFLPIDPWIDANYIRKIENDPIMFQGKIICGPDTYRILKEQFK